MIRLFDKAETNFNHNKWILSECTSAIVTEDLEGIFDLDLEYPLFDTKGISKYLLRGNIIKCPISTTDTRGEQLFKIRTVKTDTSTKRVTVYAQAIARADLMSNFVLGVEVPKGKTRKQAMAILLAGCVEKKGYYVGNLDTSTNTTINLGLEDATGNVIDYLDIAYVSPLEGILGESQSIKAAYGGEIIFNNKEVNMVDERGTDHSFEIRSGKNLQELQQEIDDTDSENFATALIMCSSDGVYLPNNEIIYSSNANIFDRKFFKKVVCDDVKLVDDTTEAMNIVYAQLRERGKKLFADGLDTIKTNNTVNFIQLANTEEYKEYAQLEKCELGNNVTIKYPKANLTASQRVIKIKFNPLAKNGKGEIVEVEIGDRKKKSIVDTINKATNNINDLDDKSNENAANIKSVEKGADEALKNYEVTMDKRAEGIELSVKNLSDNTGTSLKILVDNIQALVSGTGSSATIDLTKSAIVSSVIADALQTTISESSESVAIAISGRTNMTSIFNEYGLKIKNGSFEVEDSSGNSLLSFSTDGYAKVRDLQLDNNAFLRGSFFYNSLANMVEVYLKYLSVGTFSIGGGNDFSIGGKTLREFVKDVLTDYNLI